MKTLILTESKWRCGDYSAIPENKRGMGLTLLKNSDGFMCCLGQFTAQLKRNIKILDVSDPEKTQKEIPFLTKTVGVRKKKIINTTLSNRAMRINDKWDTTVEQKVEKLTKLFKKEGIKIIFKKKK